MIGQHIECNECNFIGRHNPNPYWYKRWVYDLGQGAVAPVEDRISWCYDCSNFAWIEKLLSQEDITTMLENYAQTGKTGESVFDDDMEFAGEVLRSEAQWRSFANERKGSKCRCINCGSTNIETEAEFDYFSSGKINAFRHPGCGGKLRIVETKSDIHISWRPRDSGERKPRAIFSRDGLIKIVESFPESASSLEESSADELFIPEYDDDEDAQNEAASSAGSAECKSRFLENPFYLLNVSLLDNSEKIRDQARSLMRTEEPGQHEMACNALIEPDRRLAAELSWVPGLSPAQASSFIKYIHSNVGWWKRNNLVSITGLPALSAANALAALLEMCGPDQIANTDTTACLIFELAAKVKELDPSEIMLTINDDREAAGFHAIELIGDIESGLLTQMGYYIRVVENAIDVISRENIDEVISIILKLCMGERFQLIGDVLVKYESKANAVLQPSVERFIHTVDLLKKQKAFPPETTVKWFGNLIQGLRDWDVQTKQLRLNLNAYGIDHEFSHTVALHARQLVALFIVHNRLDLAFQLADILQTLFDDMPAFVTELARGMKAIKDASLAQKHQEGKTDGGEPVRESRSVAEPKIGTANISSQGKHIFFEEEIGTFFRKKLSLSSNGVEWKGQRIALDAITWLLWDDTPGLDVVGNRRANNTIQLGQGRTKIVIENISEEFYTRFTEQLWAAVGTRLIEEMLLALKAGEKLSFGDAIFSDFGVYLADRKSPTKEPSFYKWQQINVTTAGGEFVICASDDADMRVSLSHYSIQNLRVLAAVVEMIVGKTHRTT